MEGSPDGYALLSPEFSNMPFESPRTILQVNYCIIIEIALIEPITATK
jgi:hypothetical protein